MAVDQNRTSSTRWQFAVAISAAMFMAGCAAQAVPSAARSVELTIVAGNDQNPNESGRPSSVAVHVYQLASTARFNTAAPFDLIGREGETLGADDLGGEEVTVSPGGSRIVTQPIKPDARFVGVTVLFRDIERTQWRYSAPIDPGGASRLTLRIQGMTATLART